MTAAKGSDPATLHGRSRPTGLTDAHILAHEAAIATPAYLYDLTVIARRYAELAQALPGFGIRYAVKANPHPAVLRQLIGTGALIDASSIGEVRRALAAGAQPGQISFTGPGKRATEIDEAVARGIGHLVVESLHQAEIASTAALQSKLIQPVLARISPVTSPKGFGARMTGIATQFGIDEEDAPATLAKIARMPGLSLDGLHFFTGSNALDPEAIGANIEACVVIVRRLSTDLGRPPRRVIFGAGFGLPYHAGQIEMDLASVSQRIRAAVEPLRADANGVEVDLELGRWLVAPAGQMLTRVVARKAGRGATIAICDGGFNAHLAACGMMGSVLRRNWPIRNLSCPEAPSEIVTLAGPLCTSIDLLARDLDLARADVGNLLAVGLSGAYGATASPQGFISQPILRELIWDGYALRDETPGSSVDPDAMVAAQ